MKRKTDCLVPLLLEAPAAWALVRANDIRILEEVKFVDPVLDVGCGDGLVAQVLLMAKNKKKFEIGIDISAVEVEKAKKRHVYRECVVGDVYNLPFKSSSFRTILSNSVVEHLGDPSRAISEMARVLETGGVLVLTVPSPYLETYLLGAKLFGDIYKKLFNRVFLHRNLYNHKGWGRIFSENSLKLLSYRYYHTPQLIRVHEALLYFAIPALVWRFLFGSWPTFLPRSVNRYFASLLSRLLRATCLKDTSGFRGGSLLLVGQKT